LGLVRVGEEIDFVMADIPGLIKDAHIGVGMGDRFLRHVERTRVLLHLIDPSPDVSPSPDERFDIIIEELASYSSSLLQTPMIAVITKLDVPENRAPARELRRRLEGRAVSVHEISAVSGEGVSELLWATVNLLKKTRETP
jgi:GTP-binding protein